MKQIDKCEICGYIRDKHSERGECPIVQKKYNYNLTYFKSHSQNTETTNVNVRASEEERCNSVQKPKTSSMPYTPLTKNKYVTAKRIGYLQNFPNFEINKESLWIDRDNVLSALKGLREDIKNDLDTYDERLMLFLINKWFPIHDEVKDEKR